MCGTQSPESAPCLPTGTRESVTVEPDRQILRFESPKRPVRTKILETLLVGVGGFVLGGLGPYRRVVRPAERAWSALTKRALRLDLDCEGLHHIDSGQQYVVAPLHEGLVDVALLLGLPLPLRFVVRAELMEWPHLGRVLRRNRHVVVPDQLTTAGLRTLVGDAQRVIEAGDSLVVFPQGSILGIEAKFKKGAFWLADRFALPVLPIVITGTHRVWEHPFSPTLRYGQRVSMRVLEPVPAGDTVSRLDSLERHMKETALNGDLAPARRFEPPRDGWWDGYDFDIDEAFPDLHAAIARRRRLGPKPD